MSERRKPRQILLSKRANVFYLEHARVLQKDERIIYLTDSGEDIEQYFNIPERNTAFVLLGKGTSITDAAMRRMAESNVIVGFCGSGGSPLFASADVVFMAPQSEYRPTEYMQAWAKAWFDDEQRLARGKALLRHRLAFTKTVWSKNAELLARRVVFPEGSARAFGDGIERARDATALLLAEAEWAKRLYAMLAGAYKLKFKREEGKGGKETREDRVNSFIDHGNYIAYGYAAVALNGLGISFSFPLLHGKTRRGALVFDIADVIKDALVMPLAFECGSDLKVKDVAFRARLIEHCHEADVLDELFDFVKQLSMKVL